MAPIEASEPLVLLYVGVAVAPAHPQPLRGVLLAEGANEVDAVLREGALVEADRVKAAQDNVVRLQGVIRGEGWAATR